MRDLTAHLRLGSEWLRPSEPADIRNAPVAGFECDFPTAPSTCSAIHEIPATTVPSTDVAKAAIAQQPFTLGATNPTAMAEIGADVDINADPGLDFGRHTWRTHGQTKQKTQARYRRSQRSCHQILPWELDRGDRGHGFWMQARDCQDTSISRSVEQQFRPRDSWT